MVWRWVWVLISLGTATPRVLAGQTAPVPEPDSLRIFFLADAHSRHADFERFLADVERERPAVVIEGGDMVHDGTEPEFLRTFADRRRLPVRWFGVRGNHDARLRGPFTGDPPVLPDTAVAEVGGFRFLLLDNSDESLSPAQFDWLERTLASGAGGRTVLVMHVPPVLVREAPLARLRHLIPFPLASPSMPDAEQVDRLVALLSRHRVLAVLAGHTHRADRVEVGGVEYVVGGTLGGLTPGWTIPHEYLDITLREGDVEVRHVPIGPPAGDPFRLVGRTIGFFVHLNRFNHERVGWSYTPSVSVEVRILAEPAGREAVGVGAGFLFERTLGAAGRTGLSADAEGLLARDAALASVGSSFRVRPLGSYNGGLFLAAGAGVNGGVQGGFLSAGVGARGSVGLEWRELAVEVRHTRATNRVGTTIAVGRRF